MAPQFYNAWIRVMGECPHQLYCAWHVDKSFRQNCRRLIPISNKVTATYKSVRTLMDGTDLQTLDQALPKFVDQMKGDRDTEAFGNFFEANFVPTVSKWAYAHRTYCGIYED